MKGEAYCLFHRFSYSLVSMLSSLQRLYQLYIPQRHDWKAARDVTTLPPPLVWGVMVISLLPLLLNQLGLEFGAAGSPVSGSVIAKQPAPLLTDALHHTLAGSFIHTILEWSAFCAAIFTVVLAFSYFTIKHDVTTPILGVTLLCAGSMDAFHTLAADRLLETVANNQNLIPFTWVLCRLCNALLTIAGVSLFLVKNPKRWAGNAAFVISVSLGFGLMAYSIIHLCANSSRLPETTFPNALFTRPWDVAPLVLFLLAGIFIYPPFYQRHPSLFSHALVISTIPNAATQMHMAFGSAALFDNHFNIAHFLKIIAYLVPLAGLILDYVYTHQAIRDVNRNLCQEVEERKQAELTLQASEIRQREKSQQLEQTLKELQQAQTQLIQSEKMSSLGQLVAGVAHEINNPVNFIHGNLQHADGYMQDVMELLHLYQAAYSTPTLQIQAKAEAIDLEFLQADLPSLLASMRVGVDRIREIVQSLRTFSRLDEAEVKDVDLHAGIDSTLMILQHRLKAKPDHPEIQVIRYYGQLPKIECHAGQLNQVFMNLLSNAIDALDERNAQMAADALAADPATITIQTIVLSGDRIAIRIADNGCGLAPDTQHRLFTPFFTTKPVGKGTGMGLSISYQIVTEKHHGSLRCHSTPGKGAEFIIELPVRLSVCSQELPHLPQADYPNRFLA